MDCGVCVAPRSCAGPGTSTGRVAASPEASIQPQSRSVTGVQRGEHGRISAAAAGLDRLGRVQVRRDSSASWSNWRITGVARGTPHPADAVRGPGQGTDHGFLNSARAQLCGSRGDLWGLPLKVPSGIRRQTRPRGPPLMSPSCFLATPGHTSATPSPPTPPSLSPATSPSTSSATSSARSNRKTGRPRQPAPRSTNGVPGPAPVSPATTSTPSASPSPSPSPSTSSSQGTQLRSLFPPLRSFSQGHLKVSPLHSIYYEVFGNPQGQPALFLHGGPGAGCFPKHAQFFDPAHFRIVLLDQRGCGRSMPRGSLEDNTTQALVGDLEQLREHLHVDKWVVLGGSWGATLAVAYAQAHPGSVAGIILRGLCLMRRRDISWVYRQGGGLDSLIPLAWSDFARGLREEELDDTVAAYYARLTSRDSATRDNAASSWLRLEMSAMFAGAPPAGSAPQPHSVLSWDGTKYLFNGEPMRNPPPAPTAKSPPQAELQNGSPGAQGVLSPGAAAGGHTEGAELERGSRKAGGGGEEGRTGVLGKAADGFSAAAQLVSGASLSSTAIQARLECHYSHHGAFLRENQLLEDVQRIRHIPTRIVHGRWDFVCPVKNAYDLHSSWPEAELRVVSTGGHSMYDAGIQHELLEATEAFKRLKA